MNCLLKPQSELKRLSKYTTNRRVCSSSFLSLFLIIDLTGRHQLHLSATRLPRNLRVPSLALCSVRAQPPLHFSTPCHLSATRLPVPSLALCSVRAQPPLHFSTPYHLSATRLPRNLWVPSLLLCSVRAQPPRSPSDARARATAAHMTERGCECSPLVDLSCLPVRFAC